MADKNRGRSVNDDDRSDDVEDLDDELIEVDDDEGDDLADDADAESARSRKKKVPASAGAVARSRSKDAGKRGGPFARVARFIREIVAELQKVIWPTRKELLTYTTVVVVFVAVMMTFVALLDLGFVRVMFLVFGKGTDSGATN